MPNNNPAGHNQYTRRKEENAAHTADPSQPQSTVATATPSTPAKRGFAAMDEEMQREIASKGGQSQGKENTPGNFANDRDRAREAGRKGGESHGSSTR
jgi:general stress protein YciG